MTGDACGKPLTLDQFLKALNGQQRELFGMFLTEPTLTRLQALVRELSLQQRCDLLGLVPISTPSNQAADFLGSTGTESGQSTTVAQNKGQAPPQAVQIRIKPEAQGPPPGKAAQPEIVDGTILLELKRRFLRREQALQHTVTRIIGSGVR